MPVTQEKPLEVAPVSAERTLETADKHLADEAKVCWIEVSRYPYQPYHQVELLHLQAEADALLIKLKASSPKQINEPSSTPASQ